MLGCLTRNIIEHEIECTANSELGNRHSNSLRVAMTDADIDRLDTSLLRRSGSGTMKLNREDHPLALLITGEDVDRSVTL